MLSIYSGKGVIMKNRLEKLRTQRGIRQEELALYDYYQQYIESKKK